MKQSTIIARAASDTRLAPGTVAFASYMRGLVDEEPLAFGLAGMVRYAQAYEHANGSKIAEDGFACEPFLEVIDGLRALLNCDGAVAMERGVTTDSKDNGTCERLYWQAREAGGYPHE